MTKLPDVTHYHGQTVEEVGQADEGWFVKMENGAKIVILDEEYEMPDPDMLVGKALMLTTMDTGQTRLYFGTDDNPHGTQVNIDPLKYGVSDPEFHEGRVVRPQHPDDEAEFSDVTPDFEPSAPGERDVRLISQEEIDEERAKALEAEDEAEPA